MKHHKAPPQFDPKGTERGQQSAWANFQQKNAGKPGVSRSNTAKTPKKQGGFDPNLPGSDERPAGGSGYAYTAHRHRSEDFGRPQPGQAFPPPPPGPPPQSPLSPGFGTSPTNQRPFADPLRPFKSRESDDGSPQIPYSEGNRKRTPYSSFIGERTPFNRESSDGLRRSASTRDASKLHPGSVGNGRARSTSPLGRQPTTKDHPEGGPKKPFVDYSDSDESNDSPTSATAEDYDSTAEEAERRPGTAPYTATPFERPKKVPTPRFNGSTNPFSPPATSNGPQANAEQPGMQQRNSNNMYVNSEPLKHDFLNQSPFAPGQWASQMFGTHTTSSTVLRKPEIPKWAWPCSVRFRGQVKEESAPPAAKPPLKKESKPAVSVDVPTMDATPDRQEAYGFFRYELERSYGDIPDNFDLDVFSQLASTAVNGQKSNSPMLDGIMSRTFSLYPQFHHAIIAENAKRSIADEQSCNNSFTFPINHDMFTPNGKSRSEENISTDFSPGGWSGEFKGSPDYFAPPPQPMGRKLSSPFGRQKSGLRSATTHVPPTNGTTASLGDMPPPPPLPPKPFGSDAGQQQTEGAPGESKFSTEEWHKTFTDPSWTWAAPPPPPKPPSPSKVAAAKAKTRKPSKPLLRPATAGTKEQPHVVDEEDANGGPEQGAPVADEDDAMDIDTTPPAQHQQQASEAVPAESPTSKEPRMYSVPPSTWRQQQQQTQLNGHARKVSSRASADASLKANLDDLANVEPMAHGAEGLKDLSDLGSTLPFQSQPSATLPTQPLEPQQLAIPPIPKAPEPPTQLTKQSWHIFTVAFGAYLKAFHAFNSTMLQHFFDREHNAQGRLSAGMSWLEATGDTSGMLAGPSGFGSYLQGVREDETVREAWGVGCERHAEACKGFEKIRERVRRLAVGGGLADH